MCPFPRHSTLLCGTTSHTGTRVRFVHHPSLLPCLCPRPTFNPITTPAAGPEDETQRPGGLLSWLDPVYAVNVTLPFPGCSAILYLPARNVSDAGFLSPQHSKHPRYCDFTPISPCLSCISMKSAPCIIPPANAQGGQGRGQP